MYTKDDNTDMNFWEFIKPTQKKILGTIIVFVFLWISNLILGFLAPAILGEDYLSEIQSVLFVNETLQKFESSFGSLLLFGVFGFLFNVIFVYLAVCLILHLAKKK